MLAFFEWCVAVLTKMWSVTVVVYTVLLILFKAWLALMDWAYASLATQLTTFLAVSSTAQAGTASAGSTYEAQIAAKVELMTNILIGMNTFFPVDYCIAGINALLSAYLLAVTIRVIKSWLPTVSG